MFLPAPFTEIAVLQDGKLSPAPHGVQGSAPRPPSPVGTYKLCSELSRRDPRIGWRRIPLPDDPIPGLPD